MTRIVFLETLTKIQKELPALLYEKIEGLFDTDNQFEFWFKSYLQGFQKFAAETVKQLIKDHPEKEIQIVRVIDKSYYSFSKRDVEDLYLAGFPSDITIRDEYIPKALEQIDTAEYNSKQARKIERWMYSQCDYLFAYTYLNLPVQENRYIKRTMKKSNLNVVLLSTEKISNLIDECIELLDEREKIIVKAYNKGVPLVSIGKTLNITGNRVDQIARRAKRRILSHLLDEGYFYDR